MEYKFTKQVSKNDCGIAVSTMIINFYQNKNFNIEEIKFNNSLSDSMLSIYNIEEILAKYKIEFISYSSTFEELIGIDFSNPLIVNTKTIENNEHFIIIYKKNKKNFLIADPNDNDLKWISEDELKNIYQGYFGITKRIEKINFKTESFMSWFYFLNKFKLLILLIMTISLVSNIFILINNNFLKIYLNNVNINNVKLQQEIFIIFGIVFLFQIFMGYFINKIINNIKIKVSQNMFNSFKNKLIKLDIEIFYSISKEEWSKKLHHINIMVDFLILVSLKLPLEFLLFLMASIILTTISPIILFVILIQNFLTLIISFTITYFMKAYKLRIEKKLIKFSYSFREILDGFEEIKYKKIENKINQKIESKFNDTLINSKSIFDLNNRSSLWITIINKFFFFLIFFISFFLINKNYFNIGDLLFYTSISIYINNFGSLLTNIILNIEEIKISNKSLNFLFSRKKEEKTEYINIEKIDKIEFKNIYKYNNETCMLKDVSFIFDKNTFIYGKSGSGKTTLLKLLSGNYLKYEGSFLINEKTNFKNINYEKYKKNVIYLGQYDYLFEGTVWENIQQFKNIIDINLFTEFKFFEILERNNIEVTKIINENGANLSKGQRQIINFMSLFFTDNQVYLIDEPLSNVDKHTAYYLFKLFIEYKKNTLIIMCDHDLSYINFFENRLEIS